MAEVRRALAAMDDTALEGELREIASAIAYPSAGSSPNDIASHVRDRISAGPPTARPTRGFIGWLRGRPVRRSLVVAIAVLLIVVAVAGAVGLGVPGIRILFGGPTAWPSPSASVNTSARPSATAGTLGQSLGLGTRVNLEDAERLAGLDLILPTDPAIGPPDAAYVFANRVALVWGERPGLPADPSSGVGLLINEFRGTVDEGYYTKVLDSDATVTPVNVGDSSGYWIGGSPHFFFYRDPTGQFVDETARDVGDTLIWNDGPVTYRLESQLDMDEAVRIAESLR
ncbi:MAG TPA: hypothetical protein VFV72_03620 [Candidatus Limnocylindrales bacterium]|nr:hypothetical protein [Candidatus Limnocylindrales bacterium]